MEMTRGITILKLTKEEENVLRNFYSAIIDSGYDAALDNIDSILHAIAYGDKYVFNDFSIQYSDSDN